MRPSARRQASSDRPKPTPARQEFRVVDSGLVLLAGMLLGIGYLVSPDEATLDWYTKDENGHPELMKGSL